MNRNDYCKDCKRSIHNAEIPTCDVNIENAGYYTGSGDCYCKVMTDKNKKSPLAILLEREKK